MSTFDRLSSLAECLCDTITAEGVPAVCFCGVVPGEAAASDYFGTGNCTKGVCGMAWVRLVNMYPSTSVGIADVTVGNCSKELGLDVEVGIMRCYQSARDERGNPPTLAYVAEATAQQVLDAEVMYKAISCCDDISSHDLVVGTYQPLGPEGGVVGGFWMLSMI